jgi:signal transduction histidine kinase
MIFPPHKDNVVTARADRVSGNGLSPEEGQSKLGIENCDPPIKRVWQQLVCPDEEGFMPLASLNSSRFGRPPKIQTMFKKHPRIQIRDNRSSLQSDQAPVKTRPVNLPRALRHAIERHRMQTETELIRTHQLQFKDEFLSQVSHELRSPLSAIRQFVTILLDGLAGELQPEQHEYMEIVLRNVKQLQSMISDLLEVTRVQAGKLMIEPQCTSVADAIAYAVDTLQGAATAKGITLSSDIACRLPSVCADPTRIRQILIILVDNAIKFTQANGEVKVNEHPGRAEWLHDLSLSWWGARFS